MLEGQKYKMENENGGWSILCVKECEAKCDVLESTNPDLVGEKDVWVANEYFKDAKLIK